MHIQNTERRIMRKDNVLWAVFDPPGRQEEIVLNKKGFNPVWMSEDMAYMLHDQVNRFDMDPVNIVKKLRDCAIKSKAYSVIVDWSGNMARFVRANSRQKGIACYTSGWTSRGSGKRHDLVFLGNI